MCNLPLDTRLSFYLNILRGWLTAQNKLKCVITTLTIRFFQTVHDSTSSTQWKLQNDGGVVQHSWLWSSSVSVIIHDFQIKAARVAWKAVFPSTHQAKRKNHARPFPNTWSATKLKVYRKFCKSIDEDKRGSVFFKYSSFSWFIIQCGTSHLDNVAYMPS